MEPQFDNLRDWEFGGRPKASLEDCPRAPHLTRRWAPWTARHSYREWRQVGIQPEAPALPLRSGLWLHGHHQVLEDMDFHVCPAPENVASNSASRGTDPGPHACALVSEDTGRVMVPGTQTQCIPKTHRGAWHRLDILRGHLYLMHIPYQCGFNRMSESLPLHLNNDIQELHPSSSYSDNGKGHGQSEQPWALFTLKQTNQQTKQMHKEQ